MLASTAFGRGEVDYHIEVAQILQRQPRAVPIDIGIDDSRLVSALARDLGDQRAGLARPQQQQFQ